MEDGRGKETRSKEMEIRRIKWKKGWKRQKVDEASRRRKEKKRQEKGKEKRGKEGKGNKSERTNEIRGRKTIEEERKNGINMKGRKKIVVRDKEESRDAKKKRRKKIGEKEGKEIYKKAEREEKLRNRVNL